MCYKIEMKNGSLLHRTIWEQKCPKTPTNEFLKGRVILSEISEAEGRGGAGGVGAAGLAGSGDARGISMGNDG